MTACAATDGAIQIDLCLGRGADKTAISDKCSENLLRAWRLKW